MAGQGGIKTWAWLAAMAASCVPVGAAAQSIEEIDALVTASSKPKDGLALARSQVEASAWLDALTTLERVLTIDPKNKQARLLHASILCRIDDPGGAGLAFSRLKKGDYKKADWGAARAPCEAIGL